MTIFNKHILATLLVLAVPASGTPRSSGPRLQFNAHESLGRDEVEAVREVGVKVLDWMPHWSWLNEADGTYEFRFAKADSLEGADAKFESAPGLNDEGHPLLILIWDTICANTPLPAVAIYEHMVAQFYRVTYMGWDPRVDIPLAERLQSEGIALALRDLSRSSHFGNLTESERDKVEADLEANLAEINLTRDQLDHLGCSRSLNRTLQ